MKDIRTGKMEYFYIMTCNRAHFWKFSKLEGVKKIKKNVIHIPKQQLGASGNFNGRNIGGYYCSLFPKSNYNRRWSCQANGWSRQ